MKEKPTKTQYTNSIQCYQVLEKKERHTFFPMAINSFKRNEYSKSTNKEVTTLNHSMDTNHITNTQMIFLSTRLAIISFTIPHDTVID